MLHRRFLRGPIQIQAAFWLLRRARDGYRALTPEERSRATALVKNSRGRPDRLTDNERQDLRGLARQAARR